MKRFTAILVAVLVCGVVPIWAQEDEGTSEGARVNFDFILNARPASILVDTEGKKFEVEGTKLSTLYFMPNLAAGLGVEINKLYLDFTVGGGMLLNEQFRSFLLEATACASYAASDSFMIGPRVGVVQFLDAEWIEDGDVDFDDATGFLAGLQLAMGDRISYLISVDYIGATLDANAKSGTRIRDNKDKVEIEGLTLQFGVRGEF